MIIETYNIEEIKKLVLKDIINNNPDITVLEISKLMGTSQRNTFRLLKKYKLSTKYVRTKINNMINFLSDEGYKITKE